MKCGKGLSLSLSLSPFGDGKELVLQTDQRGSVGCLLLLLFVVVVALSVVVRERGVGLEESG